MKKCKKMSESPCYVWEFTIPTDAETWEGEKDELKELLAETCKKYVFQVEKGEKEDYYHFQGRISLIEKMRTKQVAKMLGIHDKGVSRTSNNGSGSDWYVTKSETRIAGPWRDADMRIPESLREDMIFEAWQQNIINIMDIKPDRRKVNCFIDEEGGCGKSTFLLWMAVRGMIQIVPPLNSMKDIMQFCCSIFDKKGVPKAIAIDMPRAMNKSQLADFYSGIEMIKSGYIYDTRYSAKEMIYDPPHVFIFTNTSPDLSLLSKDRWRIRYI